jgi:exopolyphosphatase / guanosine-5'-triphosphate,3'-diphosphate pyrophosphatase
MMPDERLAVIDLGSNAFRLVSTGELGREPIARALATLDVFAQFAKASGLQAGSVDAVATSAIRDAKNAESFLEQARERSGLPIRVLSREA